MDPQPKPRLPWGTFLLLACALFLFWQSQPGVPEEAPLGERPLPVSGVLTQVLPEGAQAAPLTSQSALDWGALEGEVVLLEFYATWCGPCVRSLTSLSAREPRPGLRVVALSAPDQSQTVDQIEAFAREQAFPTLVLDGAAFQAYGVRTIPYAVVVDRAGRVAYKGPPGGDCDEAIAGALAASPAAEPAGAGSAPIR